jgi:hypothetical protein
MDGKSQCGMCPFTGSVNRMRIRLTDEWNMSHLLMQRSVKTLYPSPPPLVRGHHQVDVDLVSIWCRFGVDLVSSSGQYNFFNMANSCRSEK